MVEVSKTHFFVLSFPVLCNESALECEQVLVALLRKACLAKPLPRRCEKETRIESATG